MFIEVSDSVKYQNVLLSNTDNTPKKFGYY